MDVVDTKFLQLVFALFPIKLIDELIRAKCALENDSVGIACPIGEVRKDARELLEVKFQLLLNLMNPNELSNISDVFGENVSDLLVGDLKPLNAHLLGK